MWFGEQITKRGIGNGISLLIFASIIAVAPAGDPRLDRRRPDDEALLPAARARRDRRGRLHAGGPAPDPDPVREAQVGRRMTAGGSTYMPLRVNMAGVIPIIFAAAVMAFPPTIGAVLPADAGLDQPHFTPDRLALPDDRGDPDHHLHVLLHGGPVQPGRPGRQPAQVRRLHPGHPARAADGAVPRPRALAADAARRALPGGRRGRCRRSSSSYFDFSQATSAFLGGTSVLIVVGVALDTMRQMESQMMMRSYEGFLK